uniref:Chondroitin sulfate proteoglycan 4 n=1 Tax=Setaria digitata TaxID=48799 RepID=A0A915PFV8_9BILA
MVVFLPLPVSLLVSTLRLNIITRVALLAPENPHRHFNLASGNSKEHFIMRLISQNRNLTFSERSGILFADSLLIASLDNNAINTLNIRCSNDISLRITMNNATVKTILSPSLCRQNSQLKVQIGNENSGQGGLFNGCVENVTTSTEVLLDRWCSADEKSQQQERKDINLQSDGPRPPPHHLELSYFTEPLILDEGAMAAIKWRNIHGFLRHYYESVKSEVLFRLLEPPQHGKLLKYGQPVNEFTNNDILANKIYYQHDDSETTVDNIDLEGNVISQGVAVLRRNIICNIPIRINPVNDAPELKRGTESETLWITGESKLMLDNRVINLWDADSDPETVNVNIVASSGIRLGDSSGKNIRNFTLHDFLNNNVYVIRTGKENQGTLKLIASDGMLQSDMLHLSINFAPIEIQLKSNTGLKVTHQTANVITSANLSFATNLLDIPIEYVIVDVPEYGVVECRRSLGQFEICSTFTQNDIENLRVQYRHSSATHPLLDTFSFQIRADNTTSMIHVFRITFIPVHVKIFNRVPCLLNNTDNLTLKRENLFAWTFPKSFPADQLVYHIIEPPKFGTLLRRIDKNRNRRIGVSSNFTQKHIDDSAITYKMHYVQYSVINDFFIFRLIAPSVTSEEVHFDITFIPGQGSVQLINRTVIVDEGGIQKITNESLSLRTPDSSNFIFAISIAPSYGMILVNQPNGQQLKLGDGDNFTTSDIKSGNVFYKHMDGENRIDHVLLIAESTYQRVSRVPFWLTFRMILKNDNIPRLMGSNIIQITKHGDRTLYPSLLPWTDDDIDAQPLQFTFHDNFQHVAILSRISPPVPLHTFTQRQMQHEEVLIRHFGHSKVLKMNYTVSDGVHEVLSVLTIIASEPFIAIQNSNITISIRDEDEAIILVPITNHNLSAITNIDSKKSDIWFHVTTKNWIYLMNSTKKLVKNFTQQDIDEGRILYRVIATSFDDSQNEQLITAVVANLTVAKTFKILKTERDRYGEHHLEIRTLTPLIVPLSSISQIDKNILLVTALDKHPNEIVFDVIQQPMYGSLILESVKAVNNGRAVMPGNFFVSRFTQAHVNAGQIQYMHNGDLSTRDSIIFNVSTGKQKIGPYTLLISVVDDKVELFVSNLTVMSGSSKVLNNDVLYAIAPGEDNIEFRVFSDPEFGWLVRNDWDPVNISTIRQFSVQELRDHQIHYVNNPVSLEQRDTFTIAACGTGTLQCTEPKQVTVLVMYNNLHGPELLRNEVMKMWNTDKGSISKQHLFSQDDDTPDEQVRYFISRPLNGYIARVSDPSKPITNFSQAEIGNTGIGGFSFLVSDGLHEIGPEWFTVESSQEFKVIMDENGRLVVPPGRVPIVIGPDLLKVEPNKIEYSVTKIPRHGTLLLSGLPTQKFTQEDVNQYRLTYKTNIDFLDEWTKRDLFLFKVFINDSTNDSAIDEHRFKISITYAGLPSHRLHEFIQLKNVVVSCGGSVAINKSHINLDVMRKHLHEELLVDFTRKPRYGQLDVLNNIVSHVKMMKLLDLLTGRSLIYRHQDEGSVLPDEILFHIFPKNDANRRTSRLRIILPVTVLPQNDSLIKIETFLDRIKLTVENDYPLGPELFRVTHPEIKPASLKYRLIQTGSNGVKILMENRVTELFTQDDVNKGKIRVSHQQQIGGFHDIDVIVFQLFWVGSHIRALIIDILPLSLTLENHSDIEYTQGKTYVLLNRSHFGAKSKGDRSKVAYEITKLPENGTLYWVAGEKEANKFTQIDIDEERVLYAQLNMQAFQDRFEFKVKNELNETIQNTSYVRVLPVLSPRTLVVDGNSTTPITSAHLNASILQGSTPRFFVTEPPRFGRFMLNTNADSFVEFFTYNDVLNNGLLYISNQTDIMIFDFAELELDADEIQPARFRFNIEIRPSTIIKYIRPTDSANHSIPFDRSQSTTISFIGLINYHIPITVFLFVFIIIIIGILFRRHSSKKKQMRVVNAQRRREFDAKAKAELEKQPDLLSTTVYATIARNRRESSEKRPERALQTFDGSRHHVSLAPASPSQRMQSRPLSGVSMDFRTLSSRNIPEMNKSRPDRYHSTKLKDNQYWV